ncbi:MAG TPA: TerB family tellurite resistance protein [Bacteroidales bacterium]|nr:TerB family tellurite resistance protein [Bacteroidales bacterium]HRZ76741.1 TerB family tellurite resistance protein [Bacteroidales bacterium]
MAFGKWLGGGLGWALGGPIGGILGFLFGSMVDSMQSGRYEYKAPGSAPPTQEGDFALSLLVLTAAVMRADGRVVRSELDYVKDFLNRQFGPEKSGQLVLMLRELLGKDYSLRQVCLQIQANMAHPLRLQLMHFLIGIAGADGQYHKQEQAILDQIGRYLNISAADMDSLRATYSRTDESAYALLEVSPDATDDEVRKAYRKMAMKYHPDRVGNLGEDVERAAKEKFQALQEAYDRIRRQRGMN